MQIRIGTRKSPLAMAQAEQVRTLLLAANESLDPASVTLEPMSTSGDNGIAATDAGQWGLKGAFTKELEEALFANSIDIAVHSMKDVPSALPEGLHIAAILPREDVRDAFLSLTAPSFDALPEGSSVGTSSTRRAAQIRLLRPDIQIVPFRGNVGTRLEKLQQGSVHATFLAMAGLNRLGLSQHATEAMAVTRMLPAVAQGAIGIECRIDDAVETALACIHDQATALCVNAERRLMLALDGTCRSPIAAHATLDGHYLSLHGQVLAPDGSASESGHIMAPIADGEHIGHELGTFLRHQATRFFT